jgi:hypothetical protein
MLTLHCRNCDHVIKADSLSELTGAYLLHSVKQHWNEMVLLHSASDETIAQAKELADRLGWI